MIITAVDLETTGLAPPDRVVEIAACELVDDAVCLPRGTLVDPGIPIPPALSAIHHIVDEDVAGMPTWLEAVRTILENSGETLAAHQAKFERQWLTDDLTGGKPWICTYRCALRVWPEAPGHSNQELRYWLKPADLHRPYAAVAHRAGPDAYVTAFLVRALLTRATLPELIAWSEQPALLPRIQFGKHKGLTWSQAPRDYLDWIIRQTDMSEDVIHTAKHHLRETQQRAIAERQGLDDLPERRG